MIPHLLRPAWPDEARYIVQAPILERFLAAAPLRGDVLNAGCGEGLYAPLLVGDEITSWTHVDLEVPILLAVRHLGHQAVGASLTELPFADESFDTILCTEVLEHIDDDERAAKELARVLRPGGAMVMSVPMPPAPADPAHVREGYSLAALRRVLGSARLRIDLHETCFHLGMRALVHGWGLQHKAFKRNLAPRALVRGLAHLDRLVPVGPPWDLVVLARKAQ